MNGILDSGFYCYHDAAHGEFSSLGCQLVEWDKMIKSRVS